jgi:hypothetical protein
MKSIAIWLVDIGIAFSALLYWHNHQVNEAVYQTKVAIALEYNQKLIQLQNKADEVSLGLQSKVKEVEDAKQKSISDINARHRTIVTSLQKRTPRTTGSDPAVSNPGIEATPAGATGLQLSNVDGIFLSWFSRDTAELQGELMACLASYDKVRNTLLEFQLNNKATNE